jgi:hypothetical protein
MASILVRRVSCRSPVPLAVWMSLSDVSRAPAAYRPRLITSFSFPPPDRDHAFFKVMLVSRTSHHLRAAIPLREWGGGMGVARRGDKIGIEVVEDQSRLTLEIVKPQSFMRLLYPTRSSSPPSDKVISSTCGAPLSSARRGIYGQRRRGGASCQTECWT